MNTSLVDRNGLPILSHRSKKQRKAALAKTYAPNSLTLNAGQMGICEVCNATRPLTRHHLVPKALGGTNGVNIAMLCTACHVEAHTRFNHYQLAKLGTVDSLRAALLNGDCSTEGCH